MIDLAWPFATPFAERLVLHLQCDLDLDSHVERLYADHELASATQI